MVPAPLHARRENYKGREGGGTEAFRACVAAPLLSCMRRRPGKAAAVWSGWSGIKRWRGRAERGRGVPRHGTYEEKS